MSEQGQLLDGVTVDSHARREDDFYATPRWQTLALLRRLRGLVTWREVTFFEPCAGDGAISSLIHANTRWDVVTNDIVQRDPLVPDFLLDARPPASWDAFARRGPFHVIGTNVPFDAAFDIVPHMHAHAEGLLFCLLRLSWIEPTRDRGPWLRDHPPTSALILPRTDYRGNGKTDSVTSAWFIWDRGFHMRNLLPAFDYVTVEERDELIAAEKLRRLQESA